MLRTMRTIFISRDRQQLGEFLEDEVVAGLTSGRFLPTDLAWHEKMDTWKPLSTIHNLGVQPLPKLPTGPFVQSGPFGVGACIKAAWGCFKKRAGVCIAALMIFYFSSSILQIPIQFGPTVLENTGKNISENGMGFFIAACAIFFIFYVGYLIFTSLFGAGYFYFHVELLRGRSDLKNLLAGFRFPQLGQLLLSSLVTFGAALIAAVIFLFPAYFLSRALSSEVPVIVSAVLLVIGLAYLFTGWMFSFILIVDRAMPFWKAMELSRSTVTRQFFPILGFLVVLSLLLMAGFLVCCVGLLVAAPVAYLAFSNAYLQLFPDALPPELEAPTPTDDRGLT